MTRRLKLGPWLLIWGALVAAQAYAVVATIDSSPATGVLAVVILQLLKMPFTAWRLSDLGRPSDDAVLGLLPIASIGLAWQLVARTPSEGVREQRLAQWVGDLTAVQAFGKGVSLLIGGLPLFAAVILPAALLYTGMYELAKSFLVWAMDAPDATVESVKQVIVGGAVFCVAYALFQFAKRSYASRASWIPSLFALPLMYLGVTLHMRDAGQNPFIASAPFDAFDMLWQVFAGGLLSVLWLTVGDALLRGEKPSFEAVSRNLRARGADVVAVHGGAVVAVSVGLQLVVPGIHYLLVYSFTDHAVLFEPERPAFQRSSRLTVGIRRRLFKAQFLGFLVWFVPSVALGMAALGGPAGFVNSMFNPSDLPWWVTFIGNVLWLLMAALVKLTLLVVWRERTAKEAAAVAAPVSAKPVIENVFAAPMGEAP